MGKVKDLLIDLLNDLYLSESDAIQELSESSYIGEVVDCCNPDDPELDLENDIECDSER